MKKLGRWSYIKITGKHRIKTTIITCYCLVRGPSPESAYSQHLLYMSGNTNISENIVYLRQLFGYDLK